MKKMFLALVCLLLIVTGNVANAVTDTGHNWKLKNPVTLTDSQYDASAGDHIPVMSTEEQSEEQEVTSDDTFSREKQRFLLIAFGIIAIIIIFYLLYIISISRRNVRFEDTSARIEASDYEKFLDMIPQAISEFNGSPGVDMELAYDDGGKKISVIISSGTVRETILSKN